ncbi:SDR family oxidoreductase [Corticibacterium sp. UT-5YL-CI-8]|nr:SDR family oxidoreductase [Tianweitania sp. UT-5YL-CI-8]
MNGNFPKVAVVTGAGAGLGRALTIEFARHGLSVAAIGRKAADLRQTVQLAAGGIVVPFCVDVSEAGPVAEAFAEIRQRLGAPAILVNNAAIHPHRDFLQCGPSEFMDCIAINLGGAVNCAHAALLSMSRKGEGRIVNVGSFADLAPQPMASAYSVSKGALRVFSRALVADLGDRFPGIVVSTWMPGILATRMGRSSGLDPVVAARWGVELALSNDAELNGAIFEQNMQIAEPRSLKRRIADKVLRRQPALRRLGLEA